MRLLPIVLVAALAGCGGSSHSDRRLGTDRPPPRHSGTLLAALGDSITAGSPQWDPDPLVRQQLGTGANPESQYEYWAQLRLPRVRFRNCGIFGQRTDEIRARLGRCGHGADVLILQGGINDIAQGRPIAEAARDLRATVTAAKGMGLRVALVEVLPWNNGPPGTAAQIRGLNRLIHGIGRDRKVPVFPWYRALEDPAHPGRMKRALTFEGDHPSVAGYKRLARSVKLP